MKSIIVILVFASWCLICWSCTSPLNNAIIDDPSSLRVVAQVDKQISTDGTNFLQVAVYLFDKNDGSATIKDGGITVNGTDMWIQNDGFGLPYYASSLAPVAKSTYQFTITLGDGSLFGGNTITTPANLTILNVPSTQSRGQDMSVTFQNIDSTYSTSVTLTQYYTGTDTTTTVTLPVIPVRAGSFNISAANYANTSIKSVMVTLDRKIPGVINSRFMSTSSAAADFSIAKTATIH